MSSTFAYDHYLPCLNPQCKSHGRPHPNCRCYGAAHGGEIGHFCSETREHKPDCEHYMFGGGVSGEEVSPDDLAPTPAPSPQEEVAPQDLLHAAPQAHDEEVRPEDLAEPSEEVHPDDLSSEAQPEQRRGGPLSFPLLDKGQAAQLEGMSKAFLGENLTKAIEFKTGLSTPQEYAARQKQFPVTEGATEVASGALPFTIPLVGLGANVLRNAMLAGGSFGEDAIGKALLNEPGGDPKSSVAASALDGISKFVSYSIADGVFSGVKNDLVINNARKLLVKLASKPIETATGVIAGIAATHGAPVEKAWDALKVFGIAETVLGKKISAANKYIADGILHCLTGANLEALSSTSAYTQKITNGVHAALKAIEPLFKSGAGMVAKPAEEQAKNAIREWHESGGVDGEMQRYQQGGVNPGAGASLVGYARGGDVQQTQKTDHFASVYPRENALLSEMKTRTSNYLNALRPLKNSAKLAFDDEPPQKEKRREYDQAIEIAANPLGILNHINNGTLTTSHVKHLAGMLPEVHDLLAEKMTKRITEAQLNGEKPPYHKRQAMSLFLGTDLDSTLTPQAIQTLQAQYAPKPMPAPQGKPKKSTASVAKGPGAYLTDGQARTQRQQNSKA